MKLSPKTSAHNSTIDSTTTEKIVFTIKCYGKEETFKESERQNQMNFYLEGVMACEGSEQQRYMKVYSDLASGQKYCSDEYWA